MGAIDLTYDFIRRFEDQERELRELRELCQAPPAPSIDPARLDDLAADLRALRLQLDEVVAERDRAVAEREEESARYVEQLRAREARHAEETSRLSDQLTEHRERADAMARRVESLESEAADLRSEVEHLRKLPPPSPPPRSRPALDDDEIAALQRRAGEADEFEQALERARSELTDARRHYDDLVRANKSLNDEIHVLRHPRSPIGQPRTTRRRP